MISKQKRILMIEDNEMDIRLIKEMTDEAIIQLESVNHLLEGLQRLKNSEFDLVLLDLGLPDSSGTESFDKVHEQFSKIPIIILTGLIDEDMGERLVESGAQDYLIKGHINKIQLFRSINYSISRKQAELEVLDTLESMNNYNKKENKYTIIFKDNGIGMSEIDISKATEPFFTKKAKGIGLGLTVCKQVIDIHNGTLEIKSKINEGTEVIVTLPIER